MKRQLKVGDVIKCQGITSTIAEIAFQEPWQWRNAWYIEFTDTDGNYRNWKQDDDGGKAFDKNGNEIKDEKEEANMKRAQGAVEVKDFELNGVRYTNTRPNYYYKKEDGKQVRIGKAEWDAAWEASGEAERAAREAKAAESDKEAEKSVKKERKPRKSKDIAYENNGVTLTAKQVKFIKRVPDDDFYENGLGSTLWIDVFCDTIADEFNPMSAGAMVSTLREKNVIYVDKQKVNGKWSKYFGFTELGQKIAAELGLN